MLYEGDLLTLILKYVWIYVVFWLRFALHKMAGGEAERSLRKHVVDKRRSITLGVTAHVFY